jgi:hypothetical protein
MAEISPGDWAKIIVAGFTITSGLVGFGIRYVSKSRQDSEERMTALVNEKNHKIKEEIFLDTQEKFKTLFERFFELAETVSDIDHKHDLQYKELIHQSQETFRRIGAMETDTKETKQKVSEVDKKIDILIARSNP